MKHFLLFILVNLPFWALSQFSETFGAAELSPSWIGNRESFQIKNGILTAVSTFGSAEKSKTLHLSYPYTLSCDNKEWSFYIHLNTKPTNSNHIQIYPYSSDPSALNGPYIRVGHNKQNNTERLSYGIDGTMIGYVPDVVPNSSYNILHFQIKFMNGKEWIIYARDALEESVLKEVARFEAVVPTVETNYFGIKITHTTSGNKKIGIDDISAHEATAVSEEEDNKEETSVWSDCTIDGIEPLNEYEFKYCFSEAVDISRAEFYISGYGYDGKEKAYKKKVVESAPNDVIVRFQNKATENEYYTFYWENVADANGLPIKDGDISGQLKAEEDDESGSDDDENNKEDAERKATNFNEKEIRINEIMADPKGYIPETEYIELYNSLDTDAILDGCILQYGDKTKIALDNVVIKSKGYVVLYRSGDEMIKGIASYALDKFPANLSNSGKAIILFGADGNIIDRHTYEKAVKGKSWEYDDKGWHLCTDISGGTPGRENSPLSDEKEDPEQKTPEKPDEQDEKYNKPEKETFPSPEYSEIVINEILAEPFVGGSEYIELYNRSEKELSLKDVAVSTRKSDGSLNTQYSLAEYSSTLKSGKYLLLTKSIAGVENFYELPADALIHECKLPVLSNTGATIVLYRISDKLIIDEVSYSHTWHDQQLKDKRGVALERIDAEQNSQDKANWTSAASTSGYGTPGMKNSQDGRSISERDITGNETISKLKLQPDGIYQMSYSLPEPGYYARGIIFDMRGRIVSTIVENESLGTSGHIKWDGLGKNGNRLPAGIYIQYFELWNSKGDVIRKKVAFLVH